MHTVCIYNIFLHRYRSMINIQHRLVPCWLTTESIGVPSDIAKA